MISGMQALDRSHRPPSETLPEGAADCHMHVFGPFARFPLAAERAYNVAEAPLKAHERMKRRVGLHRTVFVQPSGHGNDNRAMLHALAQAGPRGRGVAVVDPGTPRADLGKMHAAGVRGARLNLHTLGSRYKGDVAEWIARYADLIGPLGWHLQILLDADGLARVEDALARSAVPIVLDHMGLPEGGKGVGQPGFQAVLRLASCGHVWAKLSGADRITRDSGRLSGALPFMRALCDVAPDRLVWGTDWPNIGFHSRNQIDGAQLLPHRELDAGELLDLLTVAVPRSETRTAILVSNPARLYGF